MIHVFVQRLDGALEFNMKEGATVLALKQAIYEELRIPGLFQELLTAGGESVGNEATLLSLRAEGESSIHLILAATPDSERVRGILATPGQKSLVLKALGVTV